MRLSIYFLFLISFSSSCVQKEPEVPLAPADQTPATFNGKSIDLYSSRYSSDIIDRLFEEAVKNDPALFEIQKQLEILQSIKTDSLEAFNEYEQNNQAYWSSLDRYIKDLNDTTSRKQMAALASELRVKQEKRQSIQMKAIEDLEKREAILTDHKILMKIVVTRPMMENYQRNELPPYNNFKSITVRYDSLVKRMQQYTRF